MSRRTKLWIAAVFVLLMTGPIVYLTLSWNPQNPLRFRVLELDPGQPLAGGPSEYEMIAIEVENTSSFPMGLFVGMIGQADTGIADLGTIAPHNQTDPAVRLSKNGIGWIELDGHERVRVLATMEPDWRDRADKHGAKVRYMWTSESKGWFGTRWSKILEWLPLRVRDRLPKPEPGGDETSLEPYIRVSGP